MILSQYTLRNIDPEKVVIPGDELFELPEKVLQFGTGHCFEALLIPQI
jgi:tagaturonate reductase